MIDLDTAAQELTASVAHVQPRLSRVQAIARRRRRRRRIAMSAAAVVLFALGGAAAMAGTDDDRGEQVHAGPTDGSTPEAADTVDYGNLRLTVPDGWAAIATDTYAEGACRSEGLILVGPDVIVPTACRQLPAIEVRVGAEVGEDGPLETRYSATNDALQLTSRSTDGDEVWSVPGLNSRLATNNGADASIVLDSVRSSARLTAQTDATALAREGGAVPTAGRKEVAFQGTSILVPEGWPEIAHIPGGEQDDPCQRWARVGPTAVLGITANPRCAPDPFWVPRDGAWILPLADTQIEAMPDIDATVTIDDLELTVVYDPGSTVMNVIVPADGNHAAVLVRIGLGVDGHTAGSILSSIHRVPDPAITLPCGPTVVVDRHRLDLPEDLDVGTLQGFGGTGSTEGCAVNLTAPTDPGRHLTFASGSLPFALGDDAQEIDGDRQVRWGTIEDGFGAEVSAERSGDGVYVLAYGVTRAEFEAFVGSLPDA